MRVDENREKKQIEVHDALSPLIYWPSTLLPHVAKECPRRDLNPHSLSETDFKSAASTIPPLGHSETMFNNLLMKNR